MVNIKEFEKLSKTLEGISDSLDYENICAFPYDYRGSNYIELQIETGTAGLYITFPEEEILNASEEKLREMVLEEVNRPPAKY